MEHVLTYEKGKVTLTGVVAVDSFAETEAKIRLKDNAVTFRGSGFVLSDMSLGAGVASFTGTVYSVTYRAKAEPTSIIKKLFK